MGVVVVVCGGQTIAIVVVVVVVVVVVMEIAGNAILPSSRMGFSSRGLLPLSHTRPT